jgi:SAM-dependent methyltransferase
MRPILEIGCGTGRMASRFAPDDYIGVDIDPAALKIARTLYPEHNFRIHDRGLGYPDAPTVLFRGLLEYVPDTDLPDLLAEACTGRRHVFIVADQQIRVDAGGHKYFRRCQADYERLMRPLGFRPDGSAIPGDTATAKMDWGAADGRKVQVRRFSR